MAKKGETFELFGIFFQHASVIIANNRIFLQQISMITANNNRLNCLHLPGITKCTFTWIKKHVIHTFQMSKKCERLRLTRIVYT